ncbi:MAG: tRNA dihydrouridine synthase DusB [Planctomycetota bacterium]
MKIGGRQIHGSVILAPMAEYTNLPFRLLAKRYGAALVFTEMVPARDLVRGERSARRLLRTEPQERPVTAQFCGRDAQELGEAARIAADIGFDFVDLNLSCPIERILKQGAGGALMAEPDHVGRLVETLVKATPLPVTVKIRSGVDADHVNAVEVSRVCEAAGAAAVALHPRTVAKSFEGAADWSLLAAVKQAVQIPVLGSGGVRTPLHVKKMLEVTGCDAVMVARGCIGAPWFFRQANHLLATGALLPAPGYDEIKRLLLEHYKLLKEHSGDRTGVSLLRRHLPHYARALGREQDFGKAVRNVRSARDFDRAVREWL